MELVGKKSSGKWTKRSLEEISQDLVRGPFGGALKKEYFTVKGYKVYEQRNAIYKSINIGNYFIDQKKYNELIRFKVEPDDFIVSCSGTIGKIFKLPPGIPKGIINQALLKIRVRDNIIDPDYFYHYFQWSKFQESIIDNSHGGAMPNLVGMKTFRETLFSLPDLSEQKKIAKALSDVTSLILNLEKLVEKKKNIKTGVLHELLFGKRRLPKFTKEWDGKFTKTDIGQIPSDWALKTLGDVGEVKMCKRIFSHQTKDMGKIPFFKIGTFGKKPDAYISEKIFNEYRERFSYPKKGDVLISAAGTIGRTVVFDGEPSYYQDSNIIWIDNNESLITNNFLFHVLKVVKYQTEGGTIQRLYNNILKSTVFACPASIREQDEISSILNELDNEIVYLEKKIRKFNFLKSGMMRKLFNGEIRLS